MSASRNPHQVTMDTFGSGEGVSYYTSYKGDRLTLAERHIITRHLSPGQRVLDLGCGTGRTTFFLERMGFDVIGVDALESMVARGRERHPHLDLRTGDARDLAEFPGGTFDAVLFLAQGLDMIHPIAERWEAVVDMHRLSRPGGVCIYTAHNHWCMLPYPPLAKVWLTNTLSGRLFRSPYRYESTPYGPIYTCYSRPSREERALKELFSQVMVWPPLGGGGAPWLVRKALNLLYPFPYFICRK